MRRLLVLFLLVPIISTAQKKQITLEDIYKKRTFQGDTVPGFSELPLDSLIDRKDVKDENGRQLDTRNFQLSNNKKRIIFLIGRELIYRRSSKANAYLFDAISKKTIRLNEGKIMHVSFSPDDSKIAFVKDNNLYLYDIPTGHTRAITTDGEWNYIINGNCDWVYEEEFEFTQAYQWSPKGNYIAYYRFDESKVKEYQFTIFDRFYNKQYSYKYPKAGEANSTVEIHIYDVKTNKDVKAKYEQGDIYIPRIKWTKNNNELVVYWMNRHQDDLKLLLTNAQTGASQTLYEEKNKYYVEITDDWWFLKDGQNFLFTSEMNGYRHLYLYSMDGKNKLQLTKGNYEVTDVNGIDERNKIIYYTMAYPSPMDRTFFAVDFTGKKNYQLTQIRGRHRILLNDDFTKYYDYYSTINTPQLVTLNDVVVDNKKGVSAKLVKLINDNAKLKARMEEYGFVKAEFIRVPNSKGDTLNGFIMKPDGFDPSKKYPLLFCNYGGPGSQEVANEIHKYYFWYQLLAQNGFIVVGIDNTGTGFRGEEFKKKTYLQLGKYEIEDQIDAAKYFSQLPYVDKNNIGHWGWSYGGFMSSLAITKGSDVFTAAIAVAPVTSWRFYDNIYTERYMRTPQENAKGYDDNSPLNFTDKIRGKFLIIHGTADDNVHFQNSAEMITAMIKNNIDFQSAYYPNKNHSISGVNDNTSFHLWSKMTNWLYQNLGNENVKTGKPVQKAF
ncbi:MAG TPA: DPP IV N-terminal domain-containing protein [Chitinophagaceae bacterium]|jgi:dipeptidyl-peptidase-4|nr:DPP IV N-terminal domain-containing protein [Chitinophagaceae bacterium]